MTSKWTRGIVWLAAAALAASGCARSGEQSAPAAPRPKVTAAATNPLPRDRVQDGGTFTWPLEDMPPNFNYFQIDGTEVMNIWVMAALMPTTYTNTADGTPVWDPDYLASAPTMVSDPKQVVTFEINPKAVWSDGTPITWQDFYWQWRASNGTNKAYNISSANGFEAIESVARGKDDREVVVTFRRKYADWQGIFSQFYPASTNKDPKTFNDGWKGKMLQTAGPFTLKSINPTSQTITLVRNDKWWGRPAKLDTIVFRVIGLDAQIDSLANGEIDAMDIGPSADIYGRAKTLSGIEIREAAGPNFRHITFNGTSPMLKDVNVRRAVAMAINRQAMADALLGPLDIRPDVLNNHIFMANQRGYQDNSGDVGKYDPVKAGQLLDAAGWTLNGKVREKDGKPLALNFIIPTTIQASRQEAELIQNMLAQVGVKAVITSVPVNDFFSKYITPGQFDLTVFSWIGTPYPVSSGRSIYLNPIHTPTGLDVQQNYARVGSPELDRLLDEASAELDPSKAIVLANQADALIWQEVHSLTTYQRPDLWACKKGLANFGAVGLAQLQNYEDIGWAKP